MKLQKLLLVSLISILFIACNKDDNKGTAATITCAWFQADNCWRQSIEAAQSCFWGSSNNGTLNGAGTSCTYSSTSNYEITFNTPVNTTDPIATEPWDFSISKDGNFCASFQETTNGMSFVTSLGTFSQTGNATNYMTTMTCPDGSTASINAFDALDCGFSNLPGYASFSGVAPDFTFSINGHPTVSNGFRCQ